MNLDRARVFPSSVLSQRERESLARGGGSAEENPCLSTLPRAVGPCSCRDFTLSTRPLGPGRMKPAKFLLHSWEGM